MKGRFFWAEAIWISDSALMSTDLPRPGAPGVSSVCLFCCDDAGRDLPCRAVPVCIIRFPVPARQSRPCSGETGKGRERAGKGDWTGNRGGRQNRVHQWRLGSRRVVVPHTPQPSSADFRRARLRVQTSGCFHVVATMVMIQTGSCLLMSFSIITESYMGRRGK